MSSTLFYNTDRVRARSKLATRNLKVIEQPRFRQSYYYHVTKNFGGLKFWQIWQNFDQQYCE